MDRFSVFASSSPILIVARVSISPMRPVRIPDQPIDARLRDGEHFLGAAKGVQSLHPLFIRIKIASSRARGRVLSRRLGLLGGGWTGYHRMGGARMARRAVLRDDGEKIC